MLPEGIEIRCCDCLSPEGLPSIPDKTVDLTVTSPPYDDLRQYGGYVFDFERTAQELWRVTKPGGVVVWVVADQTVDGDETGTSFEQALYFKKRLGFKLHDTMIYERDRTPFYDPRNKRYKQLFDYMFVLGKGALSTYHPITDVPVKRPGRKIDGNRREPNGTMRPNDQTKRFGEYQARGNVWRYRVGYMQSSSDKNAYKQPAIFPEKLAADHILSWSNFGDLVCDPMSGSGTTAKMAYALGRRFVGFDCNPDYVEIAKSRLRQQRLIL